MTETQLIKKLCILKHDNKINIGLFSNLIYKPIDSDSFKDYDGFYIAINVLREKLNFAKGEKPGDFDILIIPKSSDRLFFERTCAIEVKVVRPTRKNPKKSPDSNGITQVKGLIKDGFPLVGLIHICMTEPLQEHEKQTVQFCLTPLDVDNPANNKDFGKNTMNINVDVFSCASAKNQMKRLITKEIPKYVGLCTIGLNASEDGLHTCHDHYFSPSYEAGYFNPHVKKETIENLKQYWNKNKEAFSYARN